MKKSIKKVGNIFLFIVSVLFMSCEIGLGSSVDTEAPSITITVPATDSIIKDKFAVAGTWSDDGSIDSVNVTVKRTDGNGSQYTYDADVSGSDGSGQWLAVINPLLEDKKLIDGSYEATVAITDNGGHTVTQTRTFVIDNTAPTIVLQRPGTKVEEGEDSSDEDITPDAYGQTFSITGMGADGNTIDHIDIDIFSDISCSEESYITTITKNNVAPTIELDVASFVENEDNDYARIYGGSTKNGEQVRYCKVKAYDNAKQYAIDGSVDPIDENGNFTSDYYLYDDIYDGILENYTLTDIHKMISGTYQIANPSRAADSDTITGLLTGPNSDELITRESCFSLNPVNNPVFFVNGRDPLNVASEDDWTNYHITEGSSVVIEVATGLDGISLKEDSLRPYIVECGVDGKIYDDEGNEIEDLPENRIYIAENTDKVKSGTSYKFTVTLNSTNIECGSNYLFGVEGLDKNSNEIIPKEGKYGFRLVSVGSGPIILSVTAAEGTESIENYEDIGIYINGNNKKRFRNILNIECTDLPYEVKRAEKENVNATPDDDDYVSIASNQSAGQYEDIFTPGNYDSDKVYFYQVIDASGNKSITRSLKCYIDTEYPTNLGPTLTWSNDYEPEEGKPSKVSSATLTSNAEDENLDGLYYYIWDKSTYKTKNSLPDSEWNLLTKGKAKTVYFNDGDGEIWIKAVDKACNESYSVTPYAVDTSAPETVENCTITGSKLTNAASDLVFTLTAKDKDNGYTISVEETASPKGDDPTRIDSVKVIYLCGSALTEENYIAGAATLENEKKTGTWTITIPKATLKDNNEKSGAVKVRVTDIAGNYKDYELFTLEVDKTAPTVDIAMPTASTLNGSAVSMSGNVTEKNPKSISLYYRTTVPSAATLPTEENSGWTLYKKITSESAPETNSDANTTYGASASSIYYWNYSVDFNTLSGAASSQDTGYKKDIYWLAFAEDTAGNTSSINFGTEASPQYYTKKYTVDIDADRPVILVMGSVNLQGKGANDAAVDMSSESRVGITSNSLTLNVTDDDGISYFGYRFGSESEPEPEYTEIQGTGSTYTIPLANDGDKDIYFKIEDAAGTTFESKTSTDYSCSSPKITDGSHNYGYFDSTNYEETKATVLYATVDTSAPLTQPLEYRTANSSYEVLPDSSWSSSISATTFGGSKKQYMKLRQYAYDINNIASIKLAVEGVNDPISFEKSTTGSGDDEQTVTKKFTVTENEVDVEKDFEEWTAKINVGSGDDGLNLASGTHTCTLTVSDGVNSKSSTVVLIVDNDAPTVSITSPAANDDPVYGSIVARGSSEAGATLYYTLSLDGENAPSTDDGATNSKWTGYDIDENGVRTNAVTAGTSYSVADYVEFDDDKGLSWTIYFDGNTSNSSATHINKLLDYLTDSFGITNSEAITNNSFTSIVNIYLWIKAVDEVGNAVEEPFLIKLDPQGGRPTVSIDYPENADNSIDSFGGNFKVYGSAEDLEEGIESVWMQILSDKHRVISGSGTDVDPYVFTNALDSSTTYGSFTGSSTNNTVSTFTVKASDLDYWAKAGYTVAKMKKTNGVHTAWVVGSSVTDAVAAEYGIQADVTGATWRKLINSKSEFSPLESGNDVETANTKSNLAMRVYSYDGGKLSYPKTKQFVIDNDKPYITNVKLEQFESIDDDDSTASRNYSSGICVKGEWYLTFTANDNQHVNKINVLIDNNPVSTSDIQVKNGSANGSYYPQKYVRVKLDTGSTNSVGSYDIKVTVTDTNDTNTKEEEYTVKYDNKAPRIANTINSSYALKPKVQQSNGFYTLKSFVSDAETGVNPSGIDSVAFFFMRRTSTAAGQIYDPMLIRPSSAAEGLVDTSSSGITYEEGLFWKTINGSLSGSVFTMSASDPNVHKGGLCKIGGVNYKIADLSGSAVTLDGEPAASATSAKFALAMIVNNTVAEFASGEKSADGYYAAPGNDDGDRMIEYIDGTSVEATWEAQIVSKNIPDGPIEIHYVAFDKAGNYSIGIVGNVPWETYKDYRSPDAEDVAEKTLSNNSMASFVYAYDSANKAYVSNNAPRVVGVVVGTDFNGDNDMNDEGETITRYYSSAEGKPNDVISNYIVSSIPDQSLAKTGKGIFTLKNASEIRPEIIGGNGQLYYEYNISAQDTYLAPSSIENYVKDATLANNMLMKRNSDGDLEGAEGSDAFDDYLDSSDGSIASSKIVTGEISFDRETLSADGLDWSTKDKPSWFTIRIWDSTAGTTPFETSQYASLQIALANQTKDNVAPNVVIDPFFWNSHSDNSLYNNSYENGHITLSKDLVESYTAETYVDPKVSGKVSFRGSVYDDHDIKSIWAKFGAIECSNPVDSAAAVDEYYKLAEKTNGTWTTCGSGTSEPSGAAWNFKILSTVFTEEGQTVSWQLDIDTSALASGFANDVKLEMFARDTSWDEESNANANHQSSTTNTNDTTPGFESYSATSYNVPYYQVDVVPYITGIQGPNRSRLGKYSVKAGQSVTVEGFNFGTAIPSVYRDKTNATTGLADEGTANDVEVTGNTSTSFTITVPQYSGFIHAVWGSVSTPNNTSASPNTIAYNIQEGYVASDDLGLSEANSKGSNFWTDDVYLSVWNVGTSFVNSNNPIHGTIEKLLSSDHKYLANERYGEGCNNALTDNTLYAYWGADDNMVWDEVLGKQRYYSLFSQSDAALQNSPCEIDTCVVGGQVFVAIHDNTLVGSGTFGPGLVLMRDGQKFSAYDSTVYKYTVETIKEDKMKYQFQNPKIAGWHDDTNSSCYLYISYYDAYTHCLKYGAIEYADMIDSQNSTDLKQQVTAAKLGATDKIVVDGTDATTNTRDVGLYSDIKAVDNKPVIVYYEKSGVNSGKLRLAVGSKAIPQGADDWTIADIPSPAGSSNFGRYVSMEVGKDGELHITAQDVTNGILYYGCFKSDKSKVVDWTKVDATSSVGRWTDIKLEDSTKSGLQAKPIITYMDASKLNTVDAVKVAYISSVKSATEGTFDAMTDPAKYEASDEKLSIVTTALDSAGKTNKLAVGINSSVLAVDFLRDEQ